VDFSVQENRVIVNYDLVDCPYNEKYDIRLYFSDSNRSTEVLSTSGDVKQVSCGRYKSIIWDVLSDKSELKGNIQFEVKISKKYSVKVKKTPSFKEWKFDRGYIGASIGGFVPYGDYGNPSDNLEQNGFIINGSFGYLLNNLLGISGSLYWCGTPISEDLEIASWSNFGLMIGPLISIPFGSKVKWDLRPMIGYSGSSVVSTSSFLGGASYDGTTSGIAYNLGSGLRFNLGDNTSYLLSAEYFTTKPRFDGYPIEPNIATLSLSAGIAFRLR